MSTYLGPYPYPMNRALTSACSVMSGIASCQSQVPRFRGEGGEDIVNVFVWESLVHFVGPPIRYFDEVPGLLLEQRPPTRVETFE
jgi:hypothetical protein